MRLRDFGTTLAPSCEDGLLPEGLNPTGDPLRIELLPEVVEEMEFVRLRGTF